MSNYILSNITNNVLEFYDDENVPQELHNCIVVPSNVELYISDVETNKIVFPDSIKVIDIQYENLTSLNINFPENIEHLILQNVNLTNKNVMELFSNSLLSYKFAGVYIDGEELSILINKLYTKYFNVLPRYTTHRLANQKLMNNMIYSRIHSQIIDDIYNYVTKLEQATQFCQIIKEELIAAAFHPNRIGPLIRKYGIEMLEEF